MGKKLVRKIASQRGSILKGPLNVVAGWSKSVVKRGDIMMAVMEAKGIMIMTEETIHSNLSATVIIAGALEEGVAAQDITIAMTGVDHMVEIGAAVIVEVEIGVVVIVMEVETGAVTVTEVVAPTITTKNMLQIVTIIERDKYSFITRCGLITTIIHRLAKETFVLCYHAFRLAEMCL